MTRYIPSERGDLHDSRWRETGDEYNALLARGLSKGQAVALLAAKAGVRQPAIYKRLRRLGTLPPYNPRRSAGCTLGPGDIPGDEIVARRIERDPCPRCGTRADHGCRHTPLARPLSNVMFA